MKPEQYLEYLGRNSFGGRLASLPELDEFINKFKKEIDKEINTGINKFRSFDIWNPSFGSDSYFIKVRDELIPYFDFSDRNKISSVPIGYVYETMLNGYAAPVPREKGYVICISLCLINMLNIINLTVYSVPISLLRMNEHAGRKRACAYAAAKGMHSIDAIIHSNLGDIFIPAPFPPRTSQGTYFEIWPKSSWTIELQIYFIIAHELSHVALNHVFNNSRKSAQDIHAQELEADMSAAKVIYKIMEKRRRVDNRRTVELCLGAIGQIFYAGKAIFDFSTIDKVSQSSYPSPEERFGVVIDYFRSKLNFSNLVGKDLFMRPYALISLTARYMREDPWESVGWLSEIANECKLANDIYEEIYVLSVASDMASKAGKNDVVSQIQQYIDCAKKEHNINIPIRQAV